METNFFQHLGKLNIRGNLMISVRIGDGANTQVSVLLKDAALKDKAVNMITPMVLEGSNMELDAEFFRSITEPLQRTSQLFVNASEYEKSLATATKNTAMEKAKSSTAKSNQDAQKKKYEERMKKVDELESKKQYGQALMLVPKASEFPAFEKEINAKLTSLRSKHGTLDLFGNTSDTTDEDTVQTDLPEEEIPEEPDEEIEPNTDDNNE